MPTSCIGGPEKTLVYRCSNSSPRYSVRTTMPFLIHYLKVSQVSKYESSITLLSFLICLGESFLTPATKVQNVRNKSAKKLDFNGIDKNNPIQLYSHIKWCNLVRLFLFCSYHQYVPFHQSF